LGVLGDLRFGEERRLFQEKDIAEERSVSAAHGAPRELASGQGRGEGRRQGNPKQGDVEEREEGLEKADR